MSWDRLYIAGFSLIFGLVLATGCAGVKKNHGDSDKDEPMAIIDAHVHTQFTGKTNHLSGIVVTKDNFLAEKNANGVVGAVALTKNYDEGYVDLSADHVIHCAGTREKKPNVAKIESGLKDGHYRCIKIYLGYVYQAATDANYEPLYKLGEKYNVPVVFHTGDTYDKDGLLKYSNPMDIDEVAVKHRKVTFVIAHLGNPWVETAAEIIYKNDNVYGDISAFLVGDLSKVAPADVEEYVTKPIHWAYGYIDNPTKLMYGTDWPLTNMKNYIELVKKAIPRNHWKDVFYNNAERIYKIPGLKEKI